MRIESIRLHPFGGTRDKTMSFGPGANILEGPNEAGKSTLCAALFHALFTPTDLTPARFKKIMGRWVPRPHGDHARVTLVFTADGIQHTLIRTWGAKAGSELVLTGQPPLGDAKGVQERVRKALRWNEATWEHVLFINQAKLNQTLHSIEEADSLEEILRRSGALDGDIAPEKLIAALEQRIDERYSRWDRQNHRPEGSRGIGNPWKQGVGPVLRTYYAKEDLQQQFDAVVSHEHELDAANAAIAKAREVLDADKAFVEDGRKRKDGLNRRSLLEQGLKHRHDEVTRLMKVMTDWPGAEKTLADRKEAIARSFQELEKLQKEIANAKLHEGAEKVKAGHQALMEAKKAVEEAKNELSSLKPATKEQIDELRKLGQRIDRLEVEIKAQKLAAVLKANEPMTVQVKRGGNAEENIDLQQDAPFHCGAEGRIAITAGALEINVRSDQKDVEQLYADLELARQQHHQALAALEVTELAALIARKENHDLAQQKLDLTNERFTASLQKKTEEQWQKAMDDLKSIPATRSLIELDEEQRRILADQARADQERKTLEKDLTLWTKTYTSIDQLMLKVVDLRTSIGKEETELATLPTVPEGFPDAAAYLKALQNAETSFDHAKEQLQQALLKQSNLHGRTFDSTAEELKERYELAEREFQRQINEARAYERIHRRVLSLGKREGPDPFKAFGERVEQFTQLLTDGRYRPHLNGVKAIGVHGEKHALENDLLSQGTQGCLALAIRMAYAEIYLADTEGFMIMDDPLTDMDPGRRKCAVSAIKDFARKYQVIVMTCHPEHAVVFQDADAKYQSLNSVDAATPVS